LNNPRRLFIFANYAVIKKNRKEMAGLKQFGFISLEQTDKR
jgi:hypothetical protein